jgi:hypothetical protein
MANINLAALDMFRTANNWTVDSIANLDGKDAIKNVGEYKGRISALGRTTVEKTANNAMRTELLKSLANAFNMEGMTISDGKARFTREFLRNLERKLGVEFKRGDFTLDAQGNVNSGRPLTARRIKAILCKVGEVAANEATAGWSEGAGPTGSLSTGRADAMVFQSGKDPVGEVEGISSKAEKSGKSGKVGKSAGMDAFGPVKTKFGIRKEIYNPFFAKLDVINGKLRGAPEHVQKFYARIGKSLDYLANQLDTERESEFAPDKSALRNDQGYEFSVLELGEELKPDMHKFECYDPKKGKYVPIANTYDFNMAVLSPAIGGGFIHLERATRINEEGKEVAFSLADAPTIQPLRKYIANTLRLLVSKAIDLYFASEEAGKLGEFFEHLKEPGACIEDQGLHFVEFENKHIVKTEAMSAEEERALNLIADGKAPDLPETTVNQFMMVLEDFEGEKFFSSEKGWNKEVADGVKAQLRGKRCTMQDFDAPHELGAKVPELIGKNGLPVVKVLTDELIDELGPKVLREYFRK